MPYNLLCKTENLNVKIIINRLVSAKHYLVKW